MTEDTQKKTYEMFTELAFDIVKLDPKHRTKAHLAEQLDVVLETLYPGIEYKWPQQNEIARKYARPDLMKQHPLLESFNTAADAIEELGEKIQIQSVRPCDGRQWVFWGGIDPIKPAP